MPSQAIQNIRYPLPNQQTHTYPLEETYKKIERETIKYILQQNQYETDNSVKQKLNNKYTNQNQEYNKFSQTRKMGHTYYGHETQQIDKIIRHRSGRSLQNH
jgi:hypothetical protein